MSTKILEGSGKTIMTNVATPNSSLNESMRNVRRRCEGGVAIGVERATAIRLVAALALLLPPAGVCRAGADEPTLARFEYSEPHMGTEFKLVLYSADRDTANQAAAAAYARVAKLNKALSDYDPTSELTRLSATAGSGRAVAVSPDLWFVLERAQRLAAESEGAFDVTVGPMVKAWRSARRTKTFPSDERLAKASAPVGYRYLRLDPERRTAELLQPNMLLDLGGIAMGYAADEALKILNKHGLTRAMIDASGDIRCGDAPPGRRAWLIGIAPLTESKGPPSRYVELVNGALTTSGDAFQFVELAGTRYSHIVDPRTGLGLTNRSSVTITAPDCLTADSLATAVSVLGPEAGLKLLAKYQGAEAFIVREVDGKLTTTQSAGFRSTPEPSQHNSSVVR